ncbi:uncharacterized protein METZ01_LOCUS484823, partial [marine metagenome]
VGTSNVYYKLEGRYSVRIAIASYGQETSSFSE